MGRLIPTGAGAPGHAVEFVDDEDGRLMACQCGWRARLSSHAQSWSIHEAQHTYEQHLAEARAHPGT